MTPDRNKAFDFSDPIGYQSSSILIKVPRRENFVAQMLAYAFGWKVWGKGNFMKKFFNYMREAGFPTRPYFNRHLSLSR